MKASSHSNRSSHHGSHNGNAIVALIRRFYSLKMTITVKSHGVSFTAASEQMGGCYNSPGRISM